MTDDPIGEEIRGAIPGPGPGYWDAIERTLGEIEDERTDERDGVHTIVDVGRRTGMNEPHGRRRPFLLAVAAAIALVVAGGLVLRAASDDSADVAIGTTTTVRSPTSTTTGDTLPPDTPPPSSDSTAPSSPVTTIPPPAGTTRRCFVGGETTAGLQMMLDVDSDGRVRAAGTVGVDGGPPTRWYGFTFGPDGTVVVSTVADTSEAEAAVWLVDGQSIQLAEDAVATSAPCASLSAGDALSAGIEPSSVGEVPRILAPFDDRVCAVDRVDHPGPDAFRIVEIIDDDTVDIELRQDPDRVDVGSGFFLTDDTFVADLTRTDGTGQARVVEIFRVVGDSILVTEFGFPLDIIGCDEVDPLFDGS